MGDQKRPKMPVSAAEWNALAQKIKPHASGAFNPDRMLMSGPKHNITIWADGFTEGDAFTHFSNTTPQQAELLDSLASGERPKQYTGGKCPHSVLLYVKAGSGAPNSTASNSTEMCDVLNADLQEIQKEIQTEELEEVQKPRRSRPPLPPRPRRPRRPPPRIVFEEIAEVPEFKPELLVD